MVLSAQEDLCQVCVVCQIPNLGSQGPVLWQSDFNLDMLLSVHSTKCVQSHSGTLLRSCKILQCFTMPMNNSDIEAVVLQWSATKQNT